MDAICIGGGGPLGVYHLGACHYIQSNYDSIHTFIGTSAGAIIASLMCMRKDLTCALKNIEAFVKEVDILSKIKQGVARMLSTWGTIESRTFFTLMFDYLDIPDCTFKEFHSLTRNTLIVNSYNVNTKQETVFSHQTTPYVPIRDAIMASCAVPIVFSPVIIDCQLYVDGGVCGFAVPVHLTPEGVKCVNVHLDRTSSESSEAFHSMMDYIQSLIGIMGRVLIKSHEGCCSNCVVLPITLSEEDVYKIMYDNQTMDYHFTRMFDQGFTIASETFQKSTFLKNLRLGYSTNRMTQKNMEFVNVPGAMRVEKRNGKHENVSFDKILRRVFKLADPGEQFLDKIWQNIDCYKIAQHVIQSLEDGIKTSDLDTLAAETAISYTTTHPDYAKLASRIEISNLHKGTLDKFGSVLQILHNKHIINDHVFQMYQENKERIDQEIDYSRDYLFDYFGLKTLLRSYLTKIDGHVVERPQHMWMRVSLGIHDNIDDAMETYHHMSNLYFTHATPTLFNAGSKRQQMSSCFLMTVDDSIQNIYKSLSDCAQISKWCGGIGVNISNVRGKDSYIKGTNGKSSGIVPMMRVFNDTARYVNQGGKRLGSFAMYIEPWHSDVFEFLDLRKNSGNEHERARDLFYAMWIPDLFMKRVREKGDWSLFSPDEAPGLTQSYGSDFEELYLKYEKEGLARESVSALSLWEKIVEAQIETGTPYMMYKDACNEKSNQKNLGVIQCSNLCSEIVQYTSPDEVAVCNLASISLSKFVEGGSVNYGKLRAVVRILVRNLNKVIDKNFYPIPEAQYSNARHRPMGIGVQGLADMFALLKLPWESEEASDINQKVFEHMYFAALEESMELAKIHGSYETFPGSPASSGILQYDMWGVTPQDESLDWTALKTDIQAHGLRNSLLLALMPTASTGQILGNNECVEPFTSNVYLRRVLSGEYVVINKHLMEYLVENKMWNTEVKDEIIRNHGSVQTIAAIPHEMKQVFKTVWEIPQKKIIEMARDRGAFICQHQSLNLFIPNSKLSFNTLSQMHMYNWRSGNKGSYYLRTQPAAMAVPVTLDPRNTCESCSA